VRRRVARAKLPQLCAHCGATEGLTLDHIIPRVYGGINVQGNLPLLCPACYATKTKKEVRHRHPGANEKAGERLRRRLAAQQKAPVAAIIGAAGGAALGTPSTSSN